MHVFHSTLMRLSNSIKSLIYYVIHYLIAEDKDGMNINLQARDSGVDVYLSEAEKQLQLQPSDQNIEVGSQTSSDSVVLMAENCKLHNEIESQVKKLEEAEEKINELEEALRTMKKKEKQWREEIV